MKKLLTTLAFATLVLAMNACTKAPMPEPEKSANPATLSQSSKIYDTTRFIPRDGVAPPRLVTF